MLFAMRFPRSMEEMKRGLVGSVAGRRYFASDNGGQSNGVAAVEVAG